MCRLVSVWLTGLLRKFPLLATVTKETLGNSCTFNFFSLEYGRCRTVARFLREHKQ